MTQRHDRVRPMYADSSREMVSGSNATTEQARRERDARTEIALGRARRDTLDARDDKRSRRGADWRRRADCPGSPTMVSPLRDSARTLRRRADRRTRPAAMRCRADDREMRTCSRSRVVARKPAPKRTRASPRPVRSEGSESRRGDDRRVPKSKRTSAASPARHSARQHQEPRSEPRPGAAAAPVVGEEREPEKRERERPVRRVRPDDLVGHDRHGDDARQNAGRRARRAATRSGTATGR